MFEKKKSKKKEKTTKPLTEKVEVKKDNGVRVMERSNG